MTTCSQCGAENRKTAVECRMCGHLLAPEEESASVTVSPAEVSTIIEQQREGRQLVCAQCAATNNPEFNFCQACGSRLRTEGEPQLMKTSDGGSNPKPAPADQEETLEATRGSGQGVRCLVCSNDVPAGSRYCNLCGKPIANDSLGNANGTPSPAFRLRLIVDGAESGEAYHLGERTVIGRTQGDIRFPHDDYMSSRHSSLTRKGNRLFLKDEGSRNGTLIRIEGEEEVRPGRVFLVGRQILKLEINE